MDRQNVRRMWLGWVIAIGVGCAALGPGDSRQASSGTDLSIQVTTFEGLDGRMVFGEPQVQRGAYEPLSVSIPVRAAHDRSLRLQYRFEFFDRSGRPIRPTMDWRYILLPVQGDRVMESTAYDTAATDWRLEIRRARRR